MLGNQDLVGMIYDGSGDPRHMLMDFAMNIDKLNMANLVEEVMDEIVEFQIISDLHKIIPKGQTAWVLALRK